MNALGEELAANNEQFDSNTAKLVVVMADVNESNVNQKLDNFGPLLSDMGKRMEDIIASNDKMV